MITEDYQSLEPGNKVRLIEVDGSTFGVDDVLRFHAYNLPHTEEEIAAAGGDESKLEAKSIWWQGEEYAAWPYQIEGIEASTEGNSAQPTLTVADIESKITALCLALTICCRRKSLSMTLIRTISMRRTSLQVTQQLIRNRSENEFFTLIAKPAKFRARVSNSYSIARCRYRER